MSEVAGRLAPQVGAYHLMRSAGGRGVLPGGVPGTAPGRAVVIGGGSPAGNATQIAVGMGFHVTLLDRDVNKLREADKIFGTKVRRSSPTRTNWSTRSSGRTSSSGLFSSPAPRRRNWSPTRSSPGCSRSVLVDIAIDQGGCFEDSHPTTHADPTFRVHDSVFYCVANMPGAVPRTSTYALTNATLPYIVGTWPTGAGRRRCGAIRRSRRDSTPMAVRWFTARSRRPMG